MTPAHSQPLTGCTVAIAAERPATELAAALVRSGALVRQTSSLAGRSQVDDGVTGGSILVRSAARWAATGEVDAVIFTSAPGAAAWLTAVEEQGLLDRIRTRAAARSLILACLATVIARSLSARELRTLTFDPHRPTAVVRTLSGQLEEGALAGLSTSAGPLVVRSAGAVLNGVLVPVSPGPLAVLRALVEAGGDVRSREQLLQVLPGASVDPHAAEVAIARLRESLGVPGLIGTVVKRGYRLVTAGGAPSDDAVM